MKTKSLKFKIAITFGAMAILAIFVTRPVFSQESAKQEPAKQEPAKQEPAKQEPHKKIVVKIISDDNGAMTVIDTTMEMPSRPECPGLEDLDEIELEGIAPGQIMEDCFWEQRGPGLERRVIRSGGDRQTLNDVLGDIPMDRVVSYSIKDRKGGKRIIIDLNDAPLFEKNERVIIIRDQARMPRNKNIRIQHGRMDNHPSVPPPPPPVPPDNTSTKKTKG